MRVLFISGGNGPDYQCDMLFHGLRSLLGPDVVDCSRIDYMYKETFEKDPISKTKLYGRGFTLYGLLPNDQSVDRSNIEQKIENKYFDLIIYGSIHRCQQYLSLVLANYAPKDIVFIDGEDEANLFYAPVIGRGVYYKRELLPSFRPFAEPISFAIPEEKICKESVKIKNVAFIDPRDRGTYIYNTEEDYYMDYRESLFAYTMKKAGWDCLRHYEIIANHCIPIFVGIEECPISTMYYFPKYEILEINRKLNKHGIEYFNTNEGLAYWLESATAIHEYQIQYLTTNSLAKRILSDRKRQ